MTNWQDFKKQLTGVSEDERMLFETFANLVATRIQREIPIDEMARRLAISPTALTKLEGLDQPLTVATLSQYAAALGATIDLSVVSA